MKIFCIAFILIISGMTSCTHKAPYESQSPCAADNNPYIISHCNTKPMNTHLSNRYDRDIKILYSRYHQC